jgi:hypothetical protein
MSARPGCPGLRLFGSASWQPKLHWMVTTCDLIFCLEVLRRWSRLARCVSHTCAGTQHAIGQERTQEHSDQLSFEVGCTSPVRKPRPPVHANTFKHSKKHIHLPWQNPTLSCRNALSKKQPFPSLPDSPAILTDRLTQATRGLSGTDEYAPRPTPSR